MNITCPKCKTAFDVPNPISQAGGRQGGKARNPRKGFGSWSKARWKRYKAARKANAALTGGEAVPSNGAVGRCMWKVNVENCGKCDYYGDGKCKA